MEIVLNVAKFASLAASWKICPTFIIANSTNSWSIRRKEVCRHAISIRWSLNWAISSFDLGLNPTTEKVKFSIANTIFTGFIFWTFVNTRNFLAFSLNTFFT